MDPGLEKLRQEIAAAITGISIHELSRHPEGKWSAVEVLEHLYLTYTGTAKGMSRVLEAGKPLATISTLKHRQRRFFVLNFRFLPQGRKAPERTQPRGTPAETVVNEIGLRLSEMDEMIRACEEKLGKKAKLLDHPVLGPLTGAQWRKFHCVHGRHHLQQVRRLRAG